MSKRKPITSDRSISSHKPEDKEYLVIVKNYPKLYLMVRPNSTKTWLYRYNSPSSNKPKKYLLEYIRVLRLLVPVNYGERMKIYLASRMILKSIVNQI